MQGVGFRPYVYRLARELGLAGYVLNDARGVLLEVEGDGAGGRRVPARGSRAEAPPLAVVERVWRASRRPTGERGFAIVASPRGGRADALGLARHRDLRGLPAPSCSTPPTAATATRSSTAPTAARASRSCAASPTTGR